MKVLDAADLHNGIDQIQQVIENAVFRNVPN